MPPTVNVERIMSTALVTARSDESIDDADFEMRFANVRHLPIVDAHNQIAGIVSQRDLLRALGRAKSQAVPIREIMTTRVVTVRVGAPALEALDLMLERKIGCVPVLDGKDRLVGVVSETDLLRVAREVLLGRVTADPARKAG